MVTTILITGATSYIGGAVLNEILSLKRAEIQISALIRSKEYVQPLEALGCTPILFKGLDDLAVIRTQASLHDVFISCASSMDKASCIALIEGLTIRQTPTHYIHTSGTSNFGDHPITGSINGKIVHDVDDIFDWESRNSAQWITREVDIAITEAGERLGVETFIVNPPIIFGVGSGPGNKLSIQVPTLIKLSLDMKRAIVVGDGKGIWSIVHISDVAKFYGVLLGNLIGKQSIASGRTG